MRVLRLLMLLVLNFYHIWVKYLFISFHFMCSRNKLVLFLVCRFRRRCSGAGMLVLRCLMMSAIRDFTILLWSESHSVFCYLSEAYQGQLRHGDRAPLYGQGLSAQQYRIPLQAPGLSTDMSSYRSLSTSQNKPVGFYLEYLSPGRYFILIRCTSAVFWFRLNHSSCPVHFIDTWEISENEIVMAFLCKA